MPWKLFLFCCFAVWTLLSTVLCLKQFFSFWFWVLTLFSLISWACLLSVLCRLPLMLLFHNFHLVPVFLHPMCPFSRGSHQPPWIRLPSVAQILRLPALICFLHFRVLHSPAYCNVSHYQHIKKWTLFHLQNFKTLKPPVFLISSNRAIIQARNSNLIPFPFVLYLHCQFLSPEHLQLNISISLPTNKPTQ